MHPTTFLLVAFVVGEELSCYALVKGASAWRREKDPADLAMVVAASISLVYLVIMTVLVFTQTALGNLVRVAHVGAQALTFAVVLFLVFSANLDSPRTWRVLLLYGLAATAALGWHVIEPVHLEVQPQTIACRTWIALNLWGLGIFAVLIGSAIRQQPDNAKWLALAATVLGYALWIEELTPHASIVHPITFPQIFYAAFLLIVWKLGKLQNHSMAAGLDPLSGFGPQGNLATTAVAGERRRIARDLHDNIGSQIVNILASLDTQHNPVEKNLALSLEQCLLDLKMTVDSIDSVADSVPEALGRLRQRIQHSFDALGIRLVWRVQSPDDFECTRGGVAEQVLRIAQECLTNIIRHSQASVVEVGCRFAPESRSVVLEIRDNGCGIPEVSRHARLGKGLDNMRRRAESAGGVLLISSRAGAGTLVRLALPCGPSQLG